MLLNFYYYALSILLGTTVSLSAGLLSRPTIKITNASPSSIYLAFYHQRGMQLERASVPVYLPDDNGITLEIPPTRFAMQRVILTSKSPSLPIKTTTTYQGFLTLPVRVGAWYSDRLTYFEYTGLSSLWPTEQWQEWHSKQLRYTSYANQFPHATEQAAVINQLASNEEQAFHTARREHTINALRTFLHAPESTTQLPRIGLCCSGGGFRAMLATTGLLAGLEHIKLLSCIQTVACLSGSSWAIAPWLAEQSTIETFASNLPYRLSKGIFHSMNDQYNDLMLIKEQKELCGLPASAIDFYGLALSYTLLKPGIPNHLSLTLADLATNLSPEQIPFPIFTAVTRIQSTGGYDWLTFSPYSVCLPAGPCSIPSWALGRSFAGGVSTTNTPPPSLGYFLGMFGSSFSISFRDAFERAPEILNELATKILPGELHRSISQADWVNKKISPARLPNFAYKHDAHPSSAEEELAIVDGGYKSNLPLLPLLRHHDGALDVIIMLDSKCERPDRLVTALATWQACAAHGYQLPLFDTDALQKNSISIFTAPQAPTIIYLTLEPDSSFDPTFAPTEDSVYATPNFYYTPPQATRLIDLVKHVVVSNKNLFVDTIAQAKIVS